MQCSYFVNFRIFLSFISFYFIKDWWYFDSRNDINIGVHTCTMMYDVRWTWFGRPRSQQILPILFFLDAFYELLTISRTFFLNVAYIDALRNELIHNLLLLCLCPPRQSFGITARRCMWRKTSGRRERVCTHDVSHTHVHTQNAHTKCTQTIINFQEGRKKNDSNLKNAFRNEILNKNSHTLC